MTRTWMHALIFYSTTLVVVLFLLFLFAHTPQRMSDTIPAFILATLLTPLCTLGMYDDEKNGSSWFENTHGWAFVVASFISSIATLIVFLCGALVIALIVTILPFHLARIMTTGIATICLAVVLVPFLLCVAGIILRAIHKYILSKCVAMHKNSK